MIKEDLIKKFPKPQFSKFPDSKITELIDLYIECNYHWTHGGHIFNKDNINDMEKLNKWKQKNTKFYNNIHKKYKK